VGVTEPGSDTYRYARCPDEPSPSGRVDQP
jgi:hypothetical protein